MIRTSTDQIKSCEYLKKNNWIYDPETGIVYSGKGKPWKNPSIRMILKDKSYVIVQKTFYAWFYMLNEIPSGIFIKHKDGDNEIIVAKIRVGLLNTIINGILAFAIN